MKRNTLLKTTLALFAASAISTPAAANPEAGAVASQKRTVLRLTLSHDPAQREIALLAFKKQLANSRPQLIGSSSGSHTSMAENNCEESETADGCGQAHEDFAHETVVEVLLVRPSGVPHRFDTIILKSSGSGSGCKVQVNGPWGAGTSGCDDVGDIGESLNRVEIEKNDLKVEIVVEAAKSVVDVVSPVLPKCASVAPGNPVTPDMDYELDDYPFATDAVINAYAGNLHQLRFGQRVDVAYNSHTVRFFIFRANASQRKVELVRAGDGIPNPKNTPCKP